jgi:hypothetical protein
MICRGTPDTTFKAVFALSKLTETPIRLHASSTCDRARSGTIPNISDKTVVSAEFMGFSFQEERRPLTGFVTDMKLVSGRFQSSLASPEFSNDLVDNFNHLHIGSSGPKRRNNIETTISVSLVSA